MSKKNKECNCSLCCNENLNQKLIDAGYIDKSGRWIKLPEVFGFEKQNDQ